MERNYVLPELPYDYRALEPHISEVQLKLHHQKHHNSYVVNANALLDKMAAARKEGGDFDVKASLKELSFNVAGHVLHSLFWANMSHDGGGEPSGRFGDALLEGFGSFAQFRKEFSQAAVSAEGSGWAALVYCNKTGKLLIMQVEKHNVNVFPDFRVLLVLDVWEHAYYLDYKNERAKFVEAFWKVVDWSEVGRRFDEACCN